MSQGPPAARDPYPGGDPPPPGYGGGSSPAHRGPLFWLLPVLLLVGVFVGVYSCGGPGGETPTPVATGSSAPAPTGPVATGPTTAPPSPPVTPPTYGTTAPGTSGPPTVPGTTAPPTVPGTTAPPPEPDTAAAPPPGSPTSSSPVPVAVEAGSGGLAADSSGAAVRSVLVLAGLLLVVGSATVLVRRRGPG